MNIVFSNAVKPSEQKSTKARGIIVQGVDFSQVLGSANKTLDSHINKLSEKYRSLGKQRTDNNTPNKQAADRTNDNIINDSVRDKNDNVNNNSKDKTQQLEQPLFFRSNFTHSNSSSNAMKLLANIGKSLELIAADIENLSAFNFDIDHTIENDGVSLLSGLSDARTLVELLNSSIQDGETIESHLAGKEINFDTLITLVESLINKLDKHINPANVENAKAGNAQYILPEAMNTQISPQDKIEQKVLKLYSRMLKEINSDLKSISEDIEAKNITIIANPSASASASLINLANLSELKDVHSKISDLAEEVQAMPDGSFLVSSDEQMALGNQSGDLSQNGNFSQSGGDFNNSLMQAGQQLRAMGNAKQAVSTQSQFTLGSDNAFVKVETVRIDDVPRYVSRTVVSMKNNTSHTATLNLHPASLGKLNVEISITNSLATLKFTAESAEAVKSIEGKVNMLKESLSRSGISVNTIEVENKPSQDGGQSNFSNNFQQNGGKQDASSYQRTKKDYLNIMNFAKMRNAEDSSYSKEAIANKLHSLQRYL